VLKVRLPAQLVRGADDCSPDRKRDSMVPVTNMPDVFKNSLLSIVYLLDPRYFPPPFYHRQEACGQPLFVPCAPRIGLQDRPR